MASSAPLPNIPTFFVTPITLSDGTKYFYNLEFEKLQPQTLRSYRTGLFNTLKHDKQSADIRTTIGRVFDDKLKTYTVYCMYATVAPGVEEPVQPARTRRTAAPGTGIFNSRTLVGYFAFTTATPDDLAVLFVGAQFRGQGLGACMLTFYEGLIQSPPTYAKAVSIVALRNACRFYENAGYSVDETVVFQDDPRLCVVKKQLR